MGEQEAKGELFIKVHDAIYLSIFMYLYYTLTLPNLAIHCKAGSCCCIYIVAGAVGIGTGRARDEGWFGGWGGGGWW